MTAIKGLWHTTAMSTDYDALFGPLQRLFGAVVMHDNIVEDPAVGRRGGMVWIGDNSIELGAPAGEQSPVRNFVDRWGGGMHSVALSVDDAATSRERLAELGVQPAATVSDEIFFTRPADTAGLLLEWSATFTDDDPRVGASLTPLPRAPVAPAVEYAFVSAVAADPPAVAARLAEVLDTAVVRLVPDGPPDQITAAVSLLDCLLVLFPLTSSDEARRLWGQDLPRPRFHAHGLRVDDLSAARAALAAQGVEVVREVDGLAFLDPAAVPIPTFLCEQLLDEDPRRAEAGR